MMKNVIFIAIIALIAISPFTLIALAQDDNHAPFFSNVHAEQRAGTKLFDITYDVSDPDGDLLTIGAAVSDYGGRTFTVNASTFTGDVGSGISPGKGKRIVWDVGRDAPNVFGTNYIVKVIASDGQFSVDVTIGQDGTPMVLIPAGEFQMGNPFDEGESDERPVHTVYLDAFYIDVYEVTNEQYKKFMDATGHKAPKYWNDDKYNAPNQPVVGVLWDDAKAYAEWAGKRLPTEAEWEKAARGGLTGKKFPWGDSDPDGTQCNFADKNTNADWSDKSVDDGYQYAAPVGSYAPNGYGLYNIAGNAWEWCADWYDENYYKISPNSNPKGPGSGSNRALRGGAWANNANVLRVDNRGSCPPDHTSMGIGFRCAGLL